MLSHARRKRMVRGRSLPRQPALTETIIGTDTRSISRQLRARSSGFASFTAPARVRRNDPVSAPSEASVLYTSGTTGRPKGCMLSHGYELEAGIWYATRGHLASLRQEGERIYNLLPVYHVNSSVLSFHCSMLSGSCQIQADRFHPSRWWPEVSQTRATIVHYLGVIVPLLLGMPECVEERNHRIRFGLGAGVEPQLHGLFERRFGFPLIEVWGMTEMVR